jgi:hypothetical protein
MVAKFQKKCARVVVFGSMALAALLVLQGAAHAETVESADLLKELQAHPDTLTGSAKLPIVFCWYKGLPALYIRTDASEPGAAASQQVNLVPQLANAINAPNGAVDDIYQLTNFTQGNVIPSAPIPAGPNNTDPHYSPLWQVTLVTWNSGITPYLLKSEEAILAARDAGKLTLQKTSIVVNCPVIYTPFGGKLPLVKIDIDEHDHH